MDSLFEWPVLTIPSARKTLGVTYRSAQKHVQTLVRTGILKQLGEGNYNKAYVAEAVLSATGADRGDGS